LVVSNHWGAKKVASYSGIFVDRQIASLEKAGTRITTFDIGTSHSPIHLLMKLIELRKLVRRLEPDLIHAQYGTIVGSVGALAGAPVVISFCGDDLLTGASVNWLRAHFGFLLSNLAALRARKLICKSKGLQDALWWRRDQAVVIPNGVDLELFTPGSREVARKHLGWDQESQIVLFNAGYQPATKGLDVARESMTLVQAHLPKVQLFVLSDVQPDAMPMYYQAADVLLSASISEGSPNVIKEALACNLPVVSTPVGDVQERLAGVKPSAVVPRDPTAIAEALVQILLEGKRSNGREHVFQLGLNQVAQRVLDVYRSVVHQQTLTEMDLKT
jgi:glycosyltransferase involved in cell wall biosynthesis